MTCEASPGARRWARSTESRGRGAVSGSIKTPPCPAPTVPAMTTPIAAAYATADRPLTAVLDADPTDAEQAYDGFFGPTTVGATLEQFYVWDMVVHRWDVARSVGGDPALTDVELDRVESGADAFGDALYMEGICRPGTEPPADVDRHRGAVPPGGRHQRRAEVPGVVVGEAAELQLLLLGGELGEGRGGVGHVAFLPPDAGGCAHEVDQGGRPVPAPAPGGRVPDRGDLQVHGRRRPLPRRPDHLLRLPVAVPDAAPAGHRAGAGAGR